MPGFLSHESIFVTLSPILTAVNTRRGFGFDSIICFNLYVYLCFVVDYMPYL